MAGVFTQEILHLWRAPTYRRHLLDQLLERYRDRLCGRVYDLGGKHINRRGRFERPQQGVTEWISINIDPQVGATIVGDVTQLPFATASGDTALLCEVLEHLSQPELALAEAFRVVKPGGVLIGSMPFIFPIHGDPHDFQRFTADGIRRSLAHNGWQLEQLHGMGGPFSVVSLWLELCGDDLIMRRRTWWRRWIRRALQIGGRLIAIGELTAFGNEVVSPSHRWTTGYFFVARKPEQP